MRSDPYPLCSLAAAVAAVVLGLALSTGADGLAADIPASTQPVDGTPAEPRGASISLNFKDAPLDVVLDHLSEAAGFVIIRDVPVEGRVTIQSSQPVTPEEAVTLLNAVLKSSNFSAIRNGRTLRILSRDKARKGNVPVHIGSDPADIAATDEVITQVIPLKNMDAVASNRIWPRSSGRTATSPPARRATRSS